MRVLLFLPVLFLVACDEDLPPQPPPQVATATQTTAPPPPAPVPPSAPAVDGPKLMPVDEGPKDPSFVAYRNELLDAVKRRDVDAIVALADSKIRTTFGDGGGAAELRRILKKPGMLEDLEALLTQGGKFRNNEAFAAPYVYIAWPDSHDAFQFLAITRENVPLYQFGDRNAPVVATLSYDIVERKGEEKNGWQEVKTADGHTGWVESNSVRSPIGFRALFNKIDGTWKMTGLVAGD